MYIVVDSDYRDRDEYPDTCDFVCTLKGNYDRRVCRWKLSLAFLIGEFASQGQPYALVEFGNLGRVSGNVVSNTGNTDRAQFVVALAHAQTAYRNGAELQQRVAFTMGDYIRLRVLQPDGTPFENITRTVAVFWATPETESTCPARPI